MIDISLLDPVSRAWPDPVGVRTLRDLAPAMSGATIDSPIGPPGVPDPLRGLNGRPGALGEHRITCRSAIPPSHVVAAACAVIEPLELEIPDRGTAAGGDN